MNRLTLRYTPEDAHHGRLRVSANVSGFAAQGLAWFAKERIRTFARTLDAWPLPQDGSIALTGGIGKKADGTFPEIVQIGLTVTPLDARGGLAMRVELKNDDDATPQLAVLHITTGYANLVPFAAAIDRMLDEPEFEAVS